MSNVRYNITKDDGEDSSITVMIEGEPHVATREHPKFGELLEYVRSFAGTIGDVMDSGYILGLLSPGIILDGMFRSVSERVSIRNGIVHMDGDPVQNELADSIVNYYNAGEENFLPLVNFMEKLQTNPNPHSVEHLFRWLKQHRFAIHSDGDIVAYKGVSQDFKSSNSGYGIINGIECDGHLPNNIGNIVEMPRSKVTFDPRNGCSFGLHVGNWSYASSFANQVILVKVNPRDVVSVPTDSSDQKMRCCRYHVVAGPIDKPVDGALWAYETPTRHVTREEIQAEDNVKVLDSDVPDDIVMSDAFAEVVAPDASHTWPTKKRAARAATKKQASKLTTAQKRKAQKVSTTLTGDTEELPEFYEEFKKGDFEKLTMQQLRVVAGLWEITPLPKTKALLVTALVKKGAAIRKEWAATTKGKAK